MKKISFFILVLFFISCTSTPSIEEKKEQLSELKKELNEVQNKISALEKEIEKESNGESNKAFKASVKVKNLQTEVFKHFITVSGTIEAENSAAISPETAGQIKKIYVKEGQRVKQGEILVRLNTSTLEKNIEEVKTGLSYAEIIYKKQKNLWDQKIGSEVDYLNAQNAKEGLEDKLKSLEAQLELAHIKAPFNGIIDDIIQKEGELASPGLPIMNLINLQKLFINADVAETYLPVLKKGDKVEVEFPTFPDMNMNIPISRVGSIIHPQNRSVSIQLQIKNPKETLKPNALAIIKINDFSNENALVVPSIIIKEDMKGSFLYVAQKANGKWIAQKRYVESEIAFKDQSMISKGLAVGENVITEGYNQISDGTEIKIK